jgi:hypothetical protein
MAMFLPAMLAYLRAFVIARHTLALEAVALRQQLAFFKRKQPPEAASIRSAVLSPASADLDEMVRSSHSGQARYCSLVASRRIPIVLAVAVPPASSRPT